jgi:hypothetical protein
MQQWWTYRMRKCSVLVSVLQNWSSVSMLYRTNWRRFIPFQFPRFMQESAVVMVDLLFEEFEVVLVSILVNCPSPDELETIHSFSNFASHCCPVFILVLVCPVDEHPRFPSSWSISEQQWWTYRSRITVSESILRISREEWLGNWKRYSPFVVPSLKLIPVLCPSCPVTSIVQLIKYQRVAMVDLSLKFVLVSIHWSKLIGIGIGVWIGDDTFLPVIMQVWSWCPVSVSILSTVAIGAIQILIQKTIDFNFPTGISQ